MKQAHPTWAMPTIIVGIILCALADAPMTDYVLTGLVKRRAELTGAIERTPEALRQMLADLESLDATILQFDPTFQVESIKARAFRTPADWSNRGQMNRVVLPILRQAAEPLTGRDISLAAVGLTVTRRGIVG